MLRVSELGYTWFYVGLTVVLGFGVRLRPTLGVMLAVLLAGVATHAAKTGFELPRPSDVDARVLYEDEGSRALVANGGAPAFFALPTTEAREALRATPDPSYGFISGHTSAATALCLGLFLFFGLRRRATWIVLLAWPLLMGLSRMYLGRHFLADVTAGLALGIATALLARWLLPRRLWLLAGGVGLLCLLAPFTPLLHPSGVGQLAGLVIVLGVLAGRGYPSDDGQAWQRAARVGLLCAFYLAIHAIAGRIGAAAGWSPANPVWIPVAAISTATMFLGAIAVARRMGLYRAEA